ncbi:hypothetical protein EJB05_56063, partial [Eragrostis curvula]
MAAAAREGRRRTMTCSATSRIKMPGPSRGLLPALAARGLLRSLHGLLDMAVHRRNTIVANTTATIKALTPPIIKPSVVLLGMDEEPMRVDPVGKGAGEFVLGAEAEISTGGQKTTW